MTKEVSKEITAYVEREIIPQYSGFDRAHNTSHVRAVIDESLRLAAKYDVDLNIVYVTAAYHDLGLHAGRENHHIESAKTVRNDINLRRWFSERDIGLIADAVEDHRASSSHEPRSIYGRIVAEADRQIRPYDIIRRAVEYGLDKEPTLRKEEQWLRMQAHMHEKYAEGGYLRLYVPESGNAKGLAELRKIIADESRLHTIFEQFYSQLSPYAVRHATESDIDNIMQMISDSREIMRQNGNEKQWVNGYPSRETIMKDIAEENGYMVYRNKTDEQRSTTYTTEHDGNVAAGYFAFIIGQEPTYNVIAGGEWSDNDATYGTLHRIAKKKGYSGIAQKCLEYCKGQIDHLRIDTHRDNAAMQHILEREGFDYRGIIYVADGTERLAYQWKRKWPSKGF